MCLFLRPKVFLVWYIFKQTPLILYLCINCFHEKKKLLVGVFYDTRTALNEVAIDRELSDKQYPTLEIYLDQSKLFNIKVKMIYIVFNFKKIKGFKDN